MLSPASLPPLAAIKFVPKDHGHIQIRARVVSSECRVVDPLDAARIAPAAADVGESPGSIGDQALALGLATGHFSRHPPRSPPPNKPVDSLQTPAKMSGDFFSWQSLRRRLCMCQTHATAAVAPGCSTSGSAEGGVAPSPSALSSGDSRLPFESTSPYHAVNLSPSWMPLSTVVTVRFEVEDNGCGISEEHIYRLFQPYAQVFCRKMWRNVKSFLLCLPPENDALAQVGDRRHELGGTGLGLYISMKLIQQMGGRIGAESAGVGRGTTFWFEVPLRVLASAIDVGDDPVMLAAGLRGSVDTVPLSGSGVHSDSTPAAVSSAPTGAAVRPVTPVQTAIPDRLVALPGTNDATALPPVFGALHVLLVDDVDSIRMLMRRLLSQHVPGVSISEAAHGEGACELMAAAKASASPLFLRGVICMDKEMPGCGGFVAVQRIRALGFRGLVLGVTGNVIAEDIAAFLHHGVDAVITKPVSFRALMSHLRAFTLSQQLDVADLATSPE